MAPDATRAPPTPSTARKATWTAKNAAVPASAVHFVLRTPAARTAGRPRDDLGLACLGTRCLDRAERAQASAPGDAHGADSFLGGLGGALDLGQQGDQDDGHHDHHAERHAQQRQVEPRHQDHHRDQGQAAVMPLTMDWVATSRSSTVSEVTRDMRSPGCVRSIGRIRSRSMRPDEVQPGRQDHGLGGPPQDVFRHRTQHGGHDEQHRQQDKDLSDRQARTKARHSSPATKG